MVSSCWVKSAPGVGVWVPGSKPSLYFPHRRWRACSSVRGARSYPVVGVDALRDRLLGNLSPGQGLGFGDGRLGGRRARADEAPVGAAVGDAVALALGPALEGDGAGLLVDPGL